MDQSASAAGIRLEGGWGIMTGRASEAIHRPQPGRRP
jgi:hypothetical protein